MLVHVVSLWHFLCMCMSQIVCFAWCMVWTTPRFELQRRLSSNPVARTHNTPKPQGGVRLVAPQLVRESCRIEVRAGGAAPHACAPDWRARTPMSPRARLRKWAWPGGSHGRWVAAVLSLGPCSDPRGLSGCGLATSASGRPARHFVLRWGARRIGSWSQRLLSRAAGDRECARGGVGPAHTRPAAVPYGTAGLGEGPGFWSLSPRPTPLLVGRSWHSPLAVGRCPTAIGEASVFSHGICCAENTVAPGPLKRARHTGAPAIGGLLALGSGA